VSTTGQPGSRDLVQRVSIREPLAALERAAAKGSASRPRCARLRWLAGRYTADSVFSDVRRRWTPEQIARRAELAHRFGELLPDGVSMTHGRLAFVLSQQFVSDGHPGRQVGRPLRENVAAATVRFRSRRSRRCCGSGRTRFREHSSPVIFDYNSSGEKTICSVATLAPGPVPAALSAAAPARRRSRSRQPRRSAAPASRLAATSTRRSPRAG